MKTDRKMRSLWQEQQGAQSVCCQWSKGERENEEEVRRRERKKEREEGSSTIMRSEGRGMWFTFKASSLLLIQASLA